MPTLVDRIKQNSQLVKRGNQLFDLVNESVTQQAQRQGVPVAGTVSPQAAAEMGATQDQAKMAGSSAQLQNVERLAVMPSFGQQQIESMKQAQTGKSQLQQQQAARAQQLSQFGGRIGDIVKQVNARNIQQAQAKAGGVAGALNEEKLAALQLDTNPDTDKTKKDKLRPLLASALAGTATPEQLADLATQLPGLSASSTAEQIAAKVNEFRQTEKSAIAKSMAAALPDQILVGQLDTEDLKQLGFASKEDLAQSLGLNPAEIDKKSMEDLQKTVDSLSKQDYQLVKSLQDAINDPNLSPAARQEAMTALRQLGASGVRATEADFNKLNQAVQSADQIEIDGKSMSISELLSDEGISAAVKAYLDDPEYAKELRNASPELADFIEAHKDALTKASGKLAESAKNLAKIQADNAALSKTSDGTAISDELNRVMYGDDWGKLSGKPLTKKNFHSIVNGSYTPGYKTAYLGMMESLAKSNPTLAKQFADYSYDQLKAAHLDTEENVKAYSNYLQSVSNFKSSSDPVQAITSLFPNLTGKNGLNELITKASNMAKSGLTSPLVNQILDLFGRQAIDINDRSPANLERMQNLRKTLSDFLGIDANGEPRIPIKDGKAQDLSAASIPDIPYLLTKLGEDVAKAETAISGEYGINTKYLEDGKLDAKELEEIAKGQSADKLQSIYDKLSKGGALENPKSLKDLIDKQAESEFMIIARDSLTPLGLNVNASNQIPLLPRGASELQTLLAQVKLVESKSPVAVRYKFNKLIKAIQDRIDKLTPTRTTTPDVTEEKRGGKSTGPSRPTGPSASSSRAR